MATNKRLIKSNDEGGGSVGFIAETHTATGASNTFTATGFLNPPDLTWIRTRDRAEYLHDYDQLRYISGNPARLNIQEVGAENDGQGHFTFTSDGYTATQSGINNSTEKIVSWNWVAAGNANTFNVRENNSITSSATAAGAGITAGSITTGWSVSANIDAGFSIVNYTANAVSGATVGHGLNKELDFLIVKSTNLPEAWSVYVKDITDTDAKYLRLNEANGIYTTAFPRFIVGNFNSNVFSLGNNNSTNGISGTDKYIAYCFAEVAGFSKFGTYVGNRPSDVYVPCGFTPKFVLIKNVDVTDDWFIIDAARGDFSTNPNTYAGDAAFVGISFDALGFTLIGSANSGGTNNAGSTFVFMAYGGDLTQVINTI